ncbi:HAD family hydrolase [Pseudoneobacillus rhizosphaerae]|uniref:Phosphoglycolate phosphatase n=1 Tax=Pseudoneobacillus rhizosphaerae TaxID=2880968 RepID=A0A9C7G750_9BACI|nr:HAD family hydrolase [Pseudoneobacillus rhizosphaerae]CAG9606788.1 Phosphoglycolate phosphatase [Pseudoneobacillus rhizosphaerae]
MIKAIIFDFDGTLANTLPICFYAFKKVFKEFDDRDYSSDEIKAMFGPSETGIIRENLSHINKEQAIELYYKAYTEHHHELVKPNVEMDELLEYLKSRGIKLGIVTGKGTRSLDISLQALQMGGLFDVIITGDDVIDPKPHPEGVIKALSLLGIEKEDAMFLGDSDADIQAGKQANVYTVGVQWLPDFHSSEFSVEPDSIFTSVREFIESLKIGVKI